MPQITTIKPPSEILFNHFGKPEYACQYECECGEKVNYIDCNAKPDKLVKCWACNG